MSHRQLSKKQFEGVLFGLAIGDAIASPWEGLPSDLIISSRSIPEIVQHASGEELYYTDDTQMAIGVVEEILDYGAIEYRRLASRFAKNYHPDRGYGPMARRIINAIGHGEDWEALASSVFDGTGSLGNGAAMRVAPIGIYFAFDKQQIIDQAVESALPTHRHEVGIDGAKLIAVGTMLAAASAGKTIERKTFLTELLSVAETEEFQWQLNHALTMKPSDSLAVFGNSLEAHRSVTTSIMCFLNSPDNYTAAISRAIAQGNDVDTLAAMTGAIAGARLGIDAIPPNLIECLEDNVQGSSYLKVLSDKLWDSYRRN